jgi:hypothetical protein
VAAVLLLLSRLVLAQECDRQSVTASDTDVFDNPRWYVPGVDATSIELGMRAQQTVARADCSPGSALEFRAHKVTRLN